MTEQHEKLKADSNAVMEHVDIYQGLINRMAANSAECKKWALGLVSAILVLVAEKGIEQAAALVIVPVILFCLLDAYYLALEKQFRFAYNNFLDALHSGSLQASELYRVRVNGKLPKAQYAFQGLVFPGIANVMDSGKVSHFR
ncbi:hypothetical protein [Thiothrix nivea]|uniref:Uncharacterized protein n=1 Tax=Thiothrix nivea (strain ATCC 35100 / DSM 5205 / JP2) TaxID=870187 RepID=A0A656HBE3_THINJ|nr:hypothetical protein [Thiothrix nivea]EIJ34451.1 hypothetical protein Thini_1873 [Thiothrix nivea DSM 5205]